MNKGIPKVQRFDIYAEGLGEINQNLEDNGRWMEYDDFERYAKEAQQENKTLTGIIGNLKFQKNELVSGTEKLKMDIERLWKDYHMACARGNNRESIINKLEAENKELREALSETMRAYDMWIENNGQPYDNYHRYEQLLNKEVKP